MSKTTNPTSNTNIVRMAALFIVVIGCGWLCVVGAQVIVPIVYAIFFSVILDPLLRWVNSLIKINWLAILVSIIVFFIPILVVGGFFLLQLINIAEDLPSVQESLYQMYESFIDKIKSWIPRSNRGSGEEQIQNIVQESVKTIGLGILTSTQSLVSILLVILYTFFLLVYRRRFQKVLLDNNKQRTSFTKDLMIKIKDTVTSYIRGLAMVVILLSLLNSLGLWIIGIDYPIFWGTLAGLLAVIPYIGTIIGGLLPFAYSLATMDHSWQPWAVMGYYFLIQQVEGNIITPKIIGDQVNINPLFAVLALVFFGAIWGLAGIFIALPLTSVIRIFLDNNESTKGLAYVMKVNDD